MPEAGALVEEFCALDRTAPAQRPVPIKITATTPKTRVPDRAVHVTSSWSPGGPRAEIKPQRLEPQSRTADEQEQVVELIRRVPTSSVYRTQSR
jgi:hypothetical protein